MLEVEEQSIWETKDIFKWIDYINATSLLDKNWIFRGQKSVGYDLSTSFYRTLKESLANLDSISLKIDGFYIEKFLVQEFYDKYDNYADITIRNDNITYNDHAYSLLSVMQHYGAPTRLQDWSRCPKIASFFAFDGATLEEDSCVYALNTKVLEDIYWGKIEKKFGLEKSQGRDSYKSDIEFRNQIDSSFGQEDFDLDMSNQTINVFEPLILNKRLRAQKGVFIVPSQPHLTVSDILKHYEIDNGYYQGQSIAKKFIFKKENLINFIKVLTQKEKITHEQMYPGLEGLSLSLKQMVKYNNFTPKIGKEEMEHYMKRLELL
ncbi:FRG domain-containing protein [Paenibacillus andongensis]|uniref:FRG domain-containing protein n=1 Tax=Paenibacillus andongensis TaxID=2975482 RepID=UPI0021BA8133|nr:FRG domain-containing protein [Paenibacillus andongensis]